VTTVELIAKYGYWGEHPEWSSDDWIAEVDNRETRLSYWQWVLAKIIKE